MVKNVLNSDQISLLENLSKLCPIDTKIVIKDHPNQPIRSPNFYKRIIKIGEDAPKKTYTPNDRKK